MGRTQKNPPNNAIALLVLAALSLCCVLTVLPFLVRLVSPAVSTVSQTTDTRDPRTARPDRCHLAGEAGAGEGAGGGVQRAGIAHGRPASH